MHSRTLHSGSARAVMLVHLFAGIGWRCVGSFEMALIRSTLCWRRYSADREMLLASSPIWFVYVRTSAQAAGTRFCALMCNICAVELYWPRPTTRRSTCAARTLHDAAGHASVHIYCMMVFDFWRASSHVNTHTRKDDDDDTITFLHKDAATASDSDHSIRVAWIRNTLIIRYFTHLLFSIEHIQRRLALVEQLARFVSSKTTTTQQQENGTDCRVLQIS